MPESRCAVPRRRWGVTSPVRAAVAKNIRSVAEDSEFSFRKGPFSAFDGFGKSPSAVHEWGAGRRAQGSGELELKPSAFLVVPLALCLGPVGYALHMSASGGLLCRLFADSLRVCQIWNIDTLDSVHPSPVIYG